jgi:hypothetical protein
MAREPRTFLINGVRRRGAGPRSSGEIGVVVERTWRWNDGASVVARAKTGGMDGTGVVTGTPARPELELGGAGVAGVAAETGRNGVVARAAAGPGLELGVAGVAGVATETGRYGVVTGPELELGGAGIDGVAARTGRYGVVTGPGLGGAGVDWLAAGTGGNGVVAGLAAQLGDEGVGAAGAAGQGDGLIEPGTVRITLYREVTAVQSRRSHDVRLLALRYAS